MHRKERPIRVLVVDDSALVRQVLTAVLDAAPDVEVTGTASDPYVARRKIKEIEPDVLTLDVEMPRMDGITFLRNLMRLRPMPVVMVSSLTERGAEVTLRALELGAVDFVAKPALDVSRGLEEYAEELLAKVRVAAGARVGGLPAQYARPAGRAFPPASSRGFKATHQLVAIGASTGGTEAIKDVLTRLPADAPGIVITQHIPAAFSAAFAARMDGVSAMKVCEAADGQRILPGHAYIAPGDRHLSVHQDGARYVCRLEAGPPVNRHRPSVDVMFKSVARNIGANAVGVVLTGMGDDGARGLLEMQEAGASTFAQDEASSVVWGMPGAAVRLGAADAVVPLGEMAAAILAVTGHAQTDNGTVVNP